MTTTRRRTFPPGVLTLIGILELALVYAGGTRDWHLAASAALSAGMVALDIWDGRR